MCRIGSSCRVGKEEHEVTIYNNESVKEAIGQASFHGETWFKCPHCGRAFEFFEAVYEDDGIKVQDMDNRIFRCSCGKLFHIA